MAFDSNGQDEPRDDAPSAKPLDRRWVYASVGAVALAATGVLASTNRAAPDGGQARWSEEQKSERLPAAEVPVRAAARPADTAGEARGIVKAKNEATISSRITARITAMPFGEGKSFPAGALLAAFDCSQTHAQLGAAHAATEAYRKTYETNKELDDYQAVGKNEVAVSQANLGKAEAEANAIAAGLSDCAVRAPFAGTVVEQIGHAREIAASGQPLLKIQSGGNLEIELIVPSRWLTWLRPGAPFRFRIDETGQQAQGVVTRFGASVDAVSKTIRVTADITGKSGLVLPGMSGSAIFDQPGRAVAATRPKPVVVDGKPS